MQVILVFNLIQIFFSRNITNINGMDIVDRLQTTFCLNK